VIGKTLATARSRIRGHGCSVGRIRKVFSKARKGRVVAESPRAGLQLARGSAVKLTVSRGRR